MNYKSITITRYSDRKMYYNKRNLKTFDYLRLFQKGYIVKVKQLGVEMDTLEQIELGYKILISQLAHHVHKCSTNEIFNIGEAITKVLTGRNVYEKTELSNYTNILNVLGLRTKAPS